ncbi:peptidoglycan recognition protein family protein [Gammaproteobacteria bacterium]|nr:peptidoglycan recognition protein family protein [Gammaproteobacteria bacterium]
MMKPLIKMTTKDNKPEWIVVHHTGGTDKNPLLDTSFHTFETVQSWHINGRGWENFGYHWMIEKDGSIRKGRPETYHGAHAKKLNKKSVGICLAGNFDATLPTKKQQEALQGLLREVMSRWDIDTSKIIPHRNVANKTCYGNKLSESWARDLVKDSDEHTDCVPNNLSALIKAILLLIKK